MSQTWIYILIGWILFSIISAFISQEKGRGATTGFVVALLLSPLVAIAIFLILEPTDAIKIAKAFENSEIKRCPKCAEFIKIESPCCRYCGNEDFKRPTTM